MRIWATIYDTTGTKLSQIDAIRSAGVTERLDASGSWDLQCPLDERVIDFLKTDNEVRIFVQEDEEPAQEWLRGIILKNRIRESESDTIISVSGRDLIDELADVVVGLGRSYTAASITSIISDLVSLKSGWTAQVETSAGALLQTARYDGASALKAIVRTVEERGLHFRNGTAARTLEVGAFGSALTTASGETIRAIQPPSSIGRELYDNDAVMLIDDISVEESVDDVCNWCLPLGAGEGSAATTLRDTSYQILNSDNSIYRAGIASPFPIYRRVNAFGVTEYYVDASNGARQRQSTVTFKEIGPVANSTLAKQYASDALANATFAYLTRQRLKLTTYKVAVGKVRQNIRPGSQIRLVYKGIATIGPSERASRTDLTYINVDAMVWVMAVQRAISDSGIQHTLDICTVDRYAMDERRMAVVAYEAMQTQNVSVQTFPFWSEKTYTDYLEYIVFGSSGRSANFKIEIDNSVTDIVRMLIRFKTRPLFTFTRVRSQYQTSGTNFDYVFNIVEGNQHPKGLHIYIDGVDRSLELGGPWNNGGAGLDNAAINVSADITNYLTSNLYQEHTIVFLAEQIGGAAYPVPGFSTLALNGQASSGIIELDVRVLGVARAVVPS